MSSGQGTNMTDRQSFLPFLYGRQPGIRPSGSNASPTGLFYLATMITLIGLAGWLYLHQASQSATYAREIRDLAQVKERLHRDIVALRAEVAELGAYKRILDVGDARGYAIPSVTDPSGYVVVQYMPPSTVAESPVAGVRADSRPPASRGTALGQDLARRLVDELESWLSPPGTERDTG